MATSKANHPSTSCVADDARQFVAPADESEHLRLVHELRVHQIELETQNEELRTARLESEHAQRLYHDLFESAPAGYLMLNAEGVVVRANAAACKLFGVTSKATLVGRALRGFLDVQDYDCLNEHCLASRRDGRAECEIRLKCADGTRCLARLDTSPTPNNATDCLVVLTDMSERERAQRALERMNRELETRVAERTAELEAEHRRLQAEVEARSSVEAERRELEARLGQAERLQSMGMFAAGIAHDFNNLLVGVVGNAELSLASPALPSALREPVALMLRTGHDAAELKRQLLVLAGQASMETVSVSLPLAVSECLELLRPRLGEGIVVHAHYEPGLPPIAADRAYVQRVVMNLLVNALEALGAAGQINIDARAQQLDAQELARFSYASAAQPGAFVVLQVKDGGSGMDPVALSRVFDPFFTTKFTGRGLGLAIVRGIVQSHGGAIRVRSELGHGTSFEVAFPEWQQAPPHERMCDTPVQPWRGSGSVLLIDDDDTVRRVVAHMLREFGFEVTVAHGGGSGLAAFEQGEGRFKLVVLDWLMPDMNGEQVLAELRRRAPQLPVILISGYSADDLPSKDPHALRLQKPMGMGQLQAAVREALRATDDATTMVV